MLNNKTFLKVFSLVAAVLLWMYVMVEVDPQKTDKISDISISFANEDVLAERGLAAVMNDSTELTVKIQGARSDINAVRKTGLTAYVDVSGCEKGRNRGELVINVPDGITVDSMSKEYMTFDVEEIVEEEKPLAVEFDDSPADDDSVPWIVSSAYENVTVSGAESLVDKVKEVRGVVSAANISAEHSSRATVSLMAVDEDGEQVENVTIQNGEDISVDIQLFKVKTVDVDVSIENVADGFEVDGSPSSETVKIVGTADAVEGIESVSGTVDMSEINDTKDHRIDVNLELPYGIYLYDEEDTPSVRVTLKTVE